MKSSAVCLRDGGRENINHSFNHVFFHLFSHPSLARDEFRETVLGDMS